MTHKFISLLVGLLFCLITTTSGDTHILYSDGNKVYELPDEVTSITITNGKVELGYKTDEFSPTKQEKKVEKKEEVKTEETEGLTPEEKRKIKDKRKIKEAFKHFGVSFLEAFVFCLMCGIACFIVMVGYFVILRIIINLQHKYAKKS